MGPQLAVVARVLIIVVILGWAWMHHKERRRQQQQEKQAAMASDAVVFRGTVDACRGVGQRLIEQGIRSWTLRRPDAWVVVVDAGNRREAQRCLAADDDVAS